MENFETQQVSNEREINQKEKKTPWYKNFIGLFISPTKTMEGMLLQEPPKGMAMGMIIGILTAIIFTMITLLNPSMQAITAQTLRDKGLTEQMIAMSQKVALIGGIVATPITVLLISAIFSGILRIGTGIIHGKATFKSIFIIVMLSSIVQNIVSIVDGMIGYFAQLPYSVLGISTLFSTEQIMANPILKTLTQICSVSGIWGIILMIIGYKVVNKTTTKKSATVIILLQLLFIGISLGYIYIAGKMGQNAAMGQ